MTPYQTAMLLRYAASLCLHEEHAAVVCRGALLDTGMAEGEIDAAVERIKGALW